MAKKQKVCAVVQEAVEPEPKRGRRDKQLPKPDLETLLLANLAKKLNLSIYWENFKLTFGGEWDNEPSLRWSWQSGLEEHVVKKIWALATNRYSVPAKDPDSCEYTDWQDALLNNREPRYDQSWLFDELRRIFDREKLKTPFGGLAWAKPKLQKLLPWATPDGVVASVIEILSDVRPAMLVGRVHRTLPQENIQHLIGDAESPLIWKFGSTWSEWDKVPVLEEAVVKYTATEITVTCGKQSWTIDSLENLDRMKRELKRAFTNQWLHHSRHTRVVNSLRAQALVMNEDYDTEVFNCDPRIDTYRFKDSLVKTDLDYMTLCEENEIKKEEN